MDAIRQYGSPMRRYFESCKNRRAGEITVNHDEVTHQIHVGGVPITDEDFAYLKEQGFEAILDLCADNPDEAKMAERVGMESYSTFVRDGFSPEQDQFDEAVGTLRRWAGQGRKIYVHCHAGAGRAPTMVAAYLISIGFPMERALALLKIKRRFHIVSEHQRQGLREFEARVKQQKATGGNHASD